MSITAYQLQEQSVYDQLYANCVSIVRQLEFDDDGALSEILDSALDIEFTVGRNVSYIGASILVAFGGPNIRINTRHNVVEGGWGDNCIRLRYADTVGIHEACEDLFDCQR